MVISDMSQDDRQRTHQRIGRRIRQIKVPARGLAVGLGLLTVVAGSYLLWRSPSVLPEAAVPVRFFQIATGSTAGTYYPVGEVIATMISEPVGGEPCTENRRCGVPGLLAVVKSSQGSIANVRAVSSGTYDAALTQADVAHWAYTGEGLFAGEPPLSDLRAIAALYPEDVHLVAARDSGIESVADLKGRRVSIDRPGSGTQVNALMILAAFGLDQDDLKVVHEGPSGAVDLMAAGKLDAFFLVAGTPAKAVSELIERGIATLVPIAGPHVDQLVEESRFFVRHTIAADTYAGVGRVSTISVKALLVTSAREDADLIHGITAALWRPGNRALLDEGHPKAREIRLTHALDGVPIPLHTGAERFYRAAGMM